MSTRVLIWAAAGLSAVFCTVVMAEQIFLASLLDVVAMGVVALMVLALVASLVIAVIRLRQDQWCALLPSLIIGFTLTFGWRVPFHLGTWIRERWLRSELEATAEAIRRAAAAGDSTILGGLPGSAASNCNRMWVRQDSVGQVVGICGATRHLLYAYDPADVTRSEPWAVREPFAPGWVRLRR